MLKAHKNIEVENSKYQKLLSEKRSIEERLEMFERQVINISSDGLKRNASDLSLMSYQENGHTINNDLQSVSNRFKFTYLILETKDVNQIITNF